MKKKNDEKKNKKVKKLIIGGAIVSLALMPKVLETIENTRLEEVPFKTIQQYVSNGDVKEITVGEKNIIIELKNGDKVKGSAALSQDSYKLFDESNIKVDTLTEVNLISLLRGLLPITIALLLAKQLFGGSKVEKSNLSSKVTFSDIAGNEEAKEHLMDIVDALNNRDKYKKFNAEAKKGILLYGPPGTGKTALARALATECGCHFIAVSSSVFANKFLGGGADKVRSIFKEAKDNQPSVIFIDELDGIGGDRGSKDSHDEYRKTLNEILHQMDGFEQSEIIVVGATNNIESLDPALTRAGRFDVKIHVGLPNISERKDIFKLYTKNRPIDESIDWDAVAKMTSHFSGSDIKNIMNSACILAIKEDADKVTFEHISKAIDIEMTGGEKKNRAGISEKDKELTAYHEAGHALIAKIVANINVPKVSIIPTTTGAGGYTLTDEGECSYLTKRELINRIAITLGGRIAEEVIYGEDNVTTGASSDIKSATNTAYHMIGNYGMRESVGMLYLSNSREGEKVIFQEAHLLIKDIYKDTFKVMKDNIHILEAIKERLLEKEVIHEDELDSIINNN